MNIAADTDAQISVNRYTGMHRQTRNQIHVNVLSHMYSGQTHTCLETQLYTGRCPSEYTGTCLREHILMNAYTNVCLETSQGNILTVRPHSIWEQSGTVGPGSPDQVPGQGLQNPSSLGRNLGHSPQQPPDAMSSHNTVGDQACVTAISVAGKGTILRRTYMDIITHKTKKPRALLPRERM